MNVGIMGLGVVGGAIAYALEQIQFNGKIMKYDPIKLPGNTADALSDCELVFICVPTPSSMSTGIQDLSHVRACLQTLAERSFSGVAVLKSTTTPDNVESVAAEFPEIRLVTNPEFLTEACANTDFLQADFHVIGGSLDDVRVLRAFYHDWWPLSDIVVTTRRAAMFTKYMINTFLALKVSYMNEMYTLWNKVVVQAGEDSGEPSWPQLMDIVTHDSRIGDSHTQVPGPDGSFGFGGKCFPKDLVALLNMGDERRVALRCLQAAYNVNNMVRYLHALDGEAQPIVGASAVAEGTRHDC